MFWIFIVPIVMGYLMGGLPTAWLVVRYVFGEGSDIRSLGDGNVGATNVGRLLGARWGLLVGVVDMIKGSAVVLASNALYTASNPGAFDQQPVSILGMLGGAAAMAGHIWPVWLGFRGGRGAATAVGVTAAVIPGPMLIMAVPTALVLLRTRNTSLGFGVAFLWSVVIAKAFFGVSWLLVLYFSSLFTLVVLTDPRFKQGVRRARRCGEPGPTRVESSMFTSYLPPNPSVKRIQLPAGPPELPIVGQTFRYLRDPIDLMEEAAQYGDLVTMSVKPWLVYLVNHPDLVREVLVTNHQRVGRWRNVEAMKYLMGDGLLTCDGPAYRRQRRLMQPAFHQQQIESFSEIMVHYAAQRAERWNDGDRVDMDWEMRNITLNIVIKSLFNQDMSPDEVRRIGAAVTFANEYMDNRFHQHERMRVILHQLPLPWTRRFRRELEFLDRVAYRVIEQRRQADVANNDLLSLLLDMRGQKKDSSERRHMTDRQVRDEIITIFAVGHETVTTALTWTWYPPGNPSGDPVTLSGGTRCSVGWTPPNRGRPAQSDLHGANHHRSDASLPTSVANGARRLGAIRAGRLPDSEGCVVLYIAVHHPPRRALVRQSDGIPPRALDAGVPKNIASVCLLSLRWWASSLHRGRVRLDGVQADYGHGRPTVAGAARSQAQDWV